MLYTIFIGTEQGKDGPLATADVALAVDAIRNRLAQTFGGYSESDVRGAWYDAAAGRLVVERSLRFEVVTDEAPEVVERLAAEARDLLAQSSVLVIGAPVVAKFV